MTAPAVPLLPSIPSIESAREQDPGDHLFHEPSRSAEMRHRRDPSRGQPTWPPLCGVAHQVIQALFPVEQPAEGGKERSIRWTKNRACYLPSKDSDLVSEYDHFDGQIGVVGPL